MKNEEIQTERYFVIFQLEGQRFALDLQAVQRVVSVVEITPLPKAPHVVLGVVNIRGSIIPVVDIRERFKLPKRDADLSDHLIIARTPRRQVGIQVDEVSDVVMVPENSVIAPKSILPEMEYVKGVMELEDGITLIHDLDRFLSLEEEEALERVLHDPARGEIDE